MNTLPKFPESLLNRIDTIHAEASAIVRNMDAEALKLISNTAKKEEKPKIPKIK